jgi:hypothetical protein
MSTTQLHGTIGHVAMHYRPGDEAGARRLFELLGCTLVDNGPNPGHDGFCSIVVAGDDWNYVDDMLYLAKASAPQLALDDAVADALGAGGDDQHPALTAWEDLRGEWPESATHVGLRFRSLDDVERAVEAVQAAGAPGGELEGRVSVSWFRARKGKRPEIDARMDASPVFGDDDRSAFSDYGVQCFVRTDLFAAGLLTFGQLIELDYYFDPAFAEPPSYGGSA